MKWIIAIFVIVVSVIALVACRSASIDRGLTYQKEIDFGHTVQFKPRRLSTGGAIGDHACIQGNYSHVYQTDNGLHGQEVWLCCVPVDEILPDSFHCAGSNLVLPIYRDPEYAKIRSCSLLHPTETEATYIPVCVPAPLVAPD